MRSLNGGVAARSSRPPVLHTTRDCHAAWLLRARLLPRTPLRTPGLVGVDVGVYLAVRALIHSLMPETERNGMAPPQTLPVSFDALTACVTRCVF